MRYYDSLGDAGYPVAGGLTYEQDWQEHLDRGSLGGVDYAVGVGTPVIAPTRGVVENHTSSGPGNYVSFYHLDDSGNRTGFYDQFLHLSRFVSPGTYELGATIGFSGNTGTQTTGPHIHWHLIDPQGTRVRFWDFFTEDEKRKDMFLVNNGSAEFVLGQEYIHHVTAAEDPVLQSVLGPVIWKSAADFDQLLKGFGIPADKVKLVMGGKTWSRILETEQLVQAGGGGGATPSAIAKAVNDDVAKRMAS